MDAEYTLKMINVLRREANAVAAGGGINIGDSRLGRSGLTVEQLEALEDRIEGQVTRSMTESETVTPEGDRLAHEIKEQHFASLAI